MVADFAAHIELGEAWLAIDPKDSPAGFIIMFARAEAWFIENVAVLPARHGEGFGGALLRMAEGTAQDRGKPLLRLYTNDAMTENLTLYPALGFRETHRIHEDGFDRVYFEKTITAA
ncbi:MAG: GNAT family N-acetyltransferase [Pseudomonadota bacterium]